jgi:drug/metabolite transporter (DMT)-like permease
MATPGLELGRESELGAAPVPLIGDRRSISRRGVLLCVVSGLSFGLAAVFAKESYHAGLTVSSMLSGRFALAAAIFWIVVARRRPARPSPRAIATAVAMGGIGYALQSAFYFGALTKMNASIVAQLLYVYPALVLIIAVLRRKESAERRKLFALGCCGAGLLLLLHGGGAGGMAPVGVLMALGAAGTYALYITVATGLPDDFDVYLLSAIVCTSAAVSLGGYGFATSTLHLPRSSDAWLWLALMAMVPTVVAIVTFLGGLRLVGGSVAAILSCLEPVVTALSAVAVYGEHLSTGQAVGGSVVLAAVVVLRMR